MRLVYVVSIILNWTFTLCPSGSLNWIFMFICIKETTENFRAKNQRFDHFLLFIACCLEDLSRAIANRDRWWERERQTDRQTDGELKESVLSAHFDGEEEACFEIKFFFLFYIHEKLFLYELIDYNRIKYDNTWNNLHTTILKISFVNRQPYSHDITINTPVSVKKNICILFVAWCHFHIK